MKYLCCLCLPALLMLSACSTTKTADKTSGSGDPETVMVTYHVKPGSEAEMQKVLAQAWDTYRHENLVFKYPHVIVRDQEDGGKPRIVEIFTWVSHSAPEHAPDSVKALWGQMQALCEERNGHGGLGGGEVTLVAPKLK